MSPIGEWKMKKQKVLEYDMGCLKCGKQDVKLYQNFLCEICLRSSLEKARTLINGLRV